jgi:ankyrin repeat protein
MLAADLGQEKIVTILLNAGAQVNLKDQANCNKTALHHACCSANDSTTIVEKLILAGANIDAASYNGITPLAYAVQHGHLAQANTLLKAKANVHKKIINSLDKTEKTVLDCAKKYPMPERIRTAIIKLLKEYGARE